MSASLDGWACTGCTYLNEDDADVCIVCGFRPEREMKTQARDHNNNNTNNVNTSHWVCQCCTLLNPPKNTTCSRCLNRRPVAVDNDNNRQNWICRACTLLNSRMDNKCSACSTPQPVVFLVPTRDLKAHARAETSSSSLTKRQKQNHPDDGDDETIDSLVMETVSKRLKSDPESIIRLKQEFEEYQKRRAPSRPLYAQPGSAPLSLSHDDKTGESKYKVQAKLVEKRIPDVPPIVERPLQLNSIMLDKIVQMVAKPIIQCERAGMGRDWTAVCVAAISRYGIEQVYESSVQQDMLRRLQEQTAIRHRKMKCHGCRLSGLLSTLVFFPECEVEHPECTHCIHHRILKWLQHTHELLNDDPPNEEVTDTSTSTSKSTNKTPISCKSTNSSLQGFGTLRQSDSESPLAKSPSLIQQLIQSTDSAAKNSNLTNCNSPSGTTKTRIVLPNLTLEVQKQLKLPTCLQCASEIPIQVVKNLLSAEQFSAYSELATRVTLLLQSMPQQPNEEKDETDRKGNNNNKRTKYMSCPNRACGEIVEVALQDESKHNQVVEPDLHFKLYRTRCVSCSTNFCTSCLVSPYHLGHSCDTWKLFRDAKKCVYCAMPLSETSNYTPGGDNSDIINTEVCDQADCIAKLKLACQKKLSCGHRCLGIKDESSVHIGCLQPECEAKTVDTVAPVRVTTPDGILTRGQDPNDFCAICYVDALSQAPLIRLRSCNHYFHAACALEKVQHGWTGSRITFEFLNCALCSKPMEHPFLLAKQEPFIAMEASLIQKSLIRLRVEHMEKDPKLLDPTSRFYNNPKLYAMHSFAYYICFKCKNPFFGGKRDCEQNANAEARPADEFICYTCAPPIALFCKLPGHEDYRAWKCRYCCSLASWFCFGTTHFCEPCHSTYGRGAGPVAIPCKGPELCELKGKHPPNGKDRESEHCIGCNLCANEDAQRQLAIAEEENIAAEVKPNSKKRDPALSSAKIDSLPCAKKEKQLKKKCLIK